MLKFAKMGLLALAISSTAGFANTPKNYTLTISNPSDTQTYQRPAQTVEIGVEVSPKLNPVDTLVIFVNDKAVAYNQNSYSFASVDYNPGEHTVRVEVQDETGRAVVSDERKIYLIQNTALMRHQREYAKQLAEYNALPWHKKIITPKPVPKSEVPMAKAVEMAK